MADSNNDKDQKGFSGLVDLVSDVSEIDEPINPGPKAEAKPSTHKQPSQEQRETVSSESEPERNTTRSSPTIEGEIYPKSSDGSGGKWIFGIIGVIFLLWLITNGEQSSHAPSYNQPSSSQSSQAPPNKKPASSQSFGRSQSKPTPAAETTNTTQSYELQYKKPAVGNNNLLSVPYIRWCVREYIRIDSMRSVIETNEAIEEFNQIVNDFNNRCGSYRYRQGDQSRAERDVEPYRGQIVLEAIFEGKNLGRPYQPRFTFLPSNESASKKPETENAYQHIREAQQLLSSLGYDPGPVDGLYGPKTEAALRSFQRNAGLTVDGQINQNLLIALRMAKTKYKAKLNDISTTQPSKANKEHIGTEIAISVSKMPIRAAMNILSQVSGRKIIVDDGIDAVVSIHVERPEPWDKILFELMEKYHLQAIFSGNTIRITQIDDPQ